MTSLDQLYVQKYVLKYEYNINAGYISVVVSIFALHHGDPGSILSPAYRHFIFIPKMEVPYVYLVQISDIRPYRSLIDLQHSIKEQKIQILVRRWTKC